MEPARAAALLSLTIITPCSRPENLPALYRSLDFRIVREWIIVHDTTRGRIVEHQFLDDPRVREVEYADASGISAAGNAQRNFALRLLHGDGYVYFLDDDNVVHPNFWRVLLRNVAPRVSAAMHANESGGDQSDVGALAGSGTPAPQTTLPYFTFNQLRAPPSGVLCGKTPRKWLIDTAMFLVHSAHAKSCDAWKESAYDADGLFIEAIALRFPQGHVFINEVACFYNALPLSGGTSL